MNLLIFISTFIVFAMLVSGQDDAAATTPAAGAASGLSGGLFWFFIPVLALGMNSYYIFTKNSVEKN